eukprot:gene8132-8326_t
MRAQLQWMMMSVELALPFNVQATISDRMPKIFKDSTIARQWACSKTKATVLVVEVLSPELHERLLRLLRANPYSVMIDETDLDDDVLLLLDQVSPKNIHTASPAVIRQLAERFPQAIAADQVNDLVEELHEFQADRVAARYAEQHKDALQFWVKVGQELTVVPMLTDSSEMGDAGTVQQQRFPLMYRLMTAMLCLPHTTADVERLFSALNIIKTKLRTRLLRSTLEALRLLEATDLLTNDVADLWGTQGEGEKVLEELEELL